MRELNNIEISVTSGSGLIDGLLHTVVGTVGTLVPLDLSTQTSGQLGGLSAGLGTILNLAKSSTLVLASALKI